MMLPYLSFENAVSLLGILLSLTAIVFTALTILRNTKVHRAQFWLDLRARFSAFDDVHQKLRPGGAWSGDGSGPVETEEWIRLEAYMGLFEHCNIMLNDGLIDEKTFEKIYAYRLRNIVKNRTIVDAKLKNEDRRKYWEEFAALLDRFGIEFR
jgi:hypothetical protein